MPRQELINAAIGYADEHAPEEQWHVANAIVAMAYIKGADFAEELVLQNAVKWLQANLNPLPWGNSVTDFVDAFYKALKETDNEP